MGGSLRGTLIRRLNNLDREVDWLETLSDDPEWLTAIAELRERNKATRERLAHGGRRKYAEGCRCLACARLKVPHGSTIGYNAWNCRCDACRAADHARYKRKNPQASRRPAPRCGTLGGYSAHRHLGEPTCPSCRAAMAAYKRDRRTRDGVASVQRVVATCGTQAGYQRHRRLGEEACDACRAASAADSRERYRKRRAEAG